MLGYVLLASWQQIQLFRLLIMLDTSYHPGLIDTIKYAYMHIYTHACTHMHIHTYTFFFWNDDFHVLYLFCSLVNPKIIGLTEECQFRIWSVSEMAGWNFCWPVSI